MDGQDAVNDSLSLAQRYGTTVLEVVDQGSKKAGTAKKPGQELMQKRSAVCPPFVHYLTPSAPIKTDEVTLHSVLLLDL